MPDFMTVMTKAFTLVATFDPNLGEIVFLSLRVSLSAVFCAALIGLPLGAAVALPPSQAVALPPPFQEPQASLAEPITGRNRCKQSPKSVFLSN